MSSQCCHLIVSHQLLFPPLFTPDSMVSTVVTVWSMIKMLCIFLTISLELLFWKLQGIYYHPGSATHQSPWEDTERGLFRFFIEIFMSVFKTSKPLIQLLMSRSLGSCVGKVLALFWGGCSTYRRLDSKRLNIKRN